MINSRLKWLLVGCGLLVIVLILEWMLIDSSENKSLKSTSMTHAALQLPTLNFEKKALESYSEMVENPLFIEGRKPVDGDSGNSLKQDDSQLDDMLLVGIYSVEGKVTALFKQKKADKLNLKKVEGDELSGWTITELYSDKVVLEKAGKKKTLMLRAIKEQRKSKVRKKSSASKRKQIKLKS